MAETDGGISITDLQHIRLELSYRGLALYPPGSSYGPRTLHDHEFVWIVEGTATWIHDGAAMPAPAGTVILARPGMRDEYRWDTRRMTKHAYFHFTLHPNGARLPPPNNWPLARVVRPDDVIPALFRQLLWISERRPPGAADMIEHAARHLFVSFLTSAASDITFAGEALPAAIVRALAAVRALWHGETLESPTLDELARAASVSPGHLCRLFMRTLGCRPVQALRLLRLQFAADTLVRSDLTIQEVARSCGFPNQFHFSRRFKEVYGVSPSEYRSADVPPEPRDRPAELARLASLLVGST